MPRNSKVKQATNQQAIVQGTKEGKTQSTIAAELGLTRETVNRNLAKLREGLQLATKEQFSEYVQNQVALLTELASQLWEGQVPPEVGNSIRAVLDSIARLTGSNAPTKSIHANVQVGNEITQGFYVEFARRTMKLKHPDSWQRLWDFIDGLPDDYAAEDAMLLEGNTHEDIH